MIDYAQMLRMQGGNQGAAQIGDLALNGGRTDVGAHLLGAIPRQVSGGQLPARQTYGGNFDINALMADAQSRVQPAPAPPPQPTFQPVIPFQPGPAAVPVPVAQAPATSLQGTIQQSNQAFGQATGLPVPAAAPVAANASPAAQMLAQPSYADIMFGTKPQAGGSGYYDPLKQSWNQGAHVRPSAYYDPLRGY